MIQNSDNIAEIECVAAWCSVLQCVALSIKMKLGVLQCVEARPSVLQCVAVCCREVAKRTLLSLPINFTKGYPEHFYLL